MKSKSENNLPTINKIEVSPKIIENLRKSGANKKCADCGDKVKLKYKPLEHFLRHFKFGYLCMLSMCPTSQRT